MPFCPQCGNPNSGGDEFCRSCGAPLSVDAAVSPGPHYSPHVLPRQTTHRQKNAALSPVLIRGLFAIILIIAAVAVLTLPGSPLSAGARNGTNTSQGSAILPVTGQCAAGLSSCSGKCVDLMTDPDNCGGCGFSVPYGETCRDGQFSSAQGRSSGGSSVLTSGTTRAGSPITSLTATGTQAACPAGRSSCTGTCRDLSNDAGNCGSCGNACLSGQNCQNGRCILPAASVTAATSTLVTVTPELSCSSGEIPCGSSCVNVFTDKKNCGVCGRTCGTGEICVDARCGPACAVSGTTLCDDSCVDLDTDMNNCGACGTECRTFLPNAKGSLCSYGKCIVSQCKTDYDDCNEIVTDGCEVNLRTDASHCGSCGTKCATGQVCYNRKCSAPIGT
jgi:hypothetical protein